MTSATSNSGRRSVLLVGTEEILLTTRKAILERDGLLVSVAHPADAVGHMKACQPDLVVTCHTLQASEVNQIAEGAAQMPHHPTLLGFTRLGAEVPVTAFDLTVDAADLPEKFVGAVRTLLRTP